MINDEGRLFEGMDPEEARRLRIDGLAMAARIQARGGPLNPPEPRPQRPDSDDPDVIDAWIERDFAWFLRNEWLGACVDLGWDPDNPGYQV